LNASANFAYRYSALDDSDSMAGLGEAMRSGEATETAAHNDDIK
jgi:hypothetical protein